MAAVRWEDGAISQIFLFNMTCNKFVKFEYYPTLTYVANLPALGGQGRFEVNLDGTLKEYETSTYYSETIPVINPFPFANDGIVAADINNTKNVFSNI